MNKSIKYRQFFRRNGSISWRHLTRILDRYHRKWDIMKQLKYSESTPPIKNIRWQLIELMVRWIKCSEPHPAPVNIHKTLNLKNEAQQQILQQGVLSH